MDTGPDVIFHSAMDGAICLSAALNGDSAGENKICQQMISVNCQPQYTVQRFEIHYKLS